RRLSRLQRGARSHRVRLDSAGCGEGAAGGLHQPVAEEVVDPTRSMFAKKRRGAMPHSLRVKGIVGATAAAMVTAGVAMFAQAGGQGRGRGPNLPPPIELAPGNAMNNPYRMLENWPHLGDIKPGAAIGIVP